MCAWGTFKMGLHGVMWSVMSNIVMVLMVHRIMVPVIASIVMVLQVIIRRIVGVVVD